MGATIVHRPEELKEEDVGTKCGLFEIKKIGDEYFTFLTECENPKACTVMLRGKLSIILFINMKLCDKRLWAYQSNKKGMYFELFVAHARSCYT